MKFTDEQIREICGGDFYLEDFPLNWKNMKTYNQKCLMNMLFNSLPQTTQGQAVAWGASDTVVRDEIFKYVLEKYLNINEDEIREKYYKKFVEYNTEEWRIKIITQILSENGISKLDSYI